MKLSVVIPTHQFEGNNHHFRRLLDSLWMQTFQDFDIVVSDNSENDIIEDICNFYRTGIKYYRNPNKGMAINTNNAIRLAEGELVKILFTDDYLIHSEVLEMIVDNFAGHWLICGSDNNPDPKWTEDIHHGNNKLGSPSCLTFKNSNPIFFDEKLTWLLDCDLYRRYHDKYGEPVIVAGAHVGIGLGPHQMTHKIDEGIKVSEYKYLVKKYE